MRARVRPLVLSALAAALTLLAANAGAQSAADRAMARELGQAGEVDLDKKDYVAAEDHFRRAEALFDAPTLLLGYARAEVGLGKLVSASETYNRIIRNGVAPDATVPFVNALAAAKAEVGAVRPRIASVIIVVTGPDNPTVTIDDQPVPLAALGMQRPVDPGDHVVKASADGWEPVERTFTVHDAGVAAASLSMTRKGAPVAVATTRPATTVGASAPRAPLERTASPHSGGTQRTLGLVGMGVGGAGIVLGAVAGAVAIGQHASLASACASGCPGTAQGDLDGYHATGAVSTVGFVAGGLIAAGGAVLFFTAPRGKSAPAALGLTVHPYAGLGSLGATGTF